MTPLVTTTMYAYPSLAALGTGGVSFGIVPPFTNSDVVVVRAVVSGVVSASDLGVGLVSANVPVGRLLYGVFDSLAEVAVPTTPFPGLAGAEGAENVVPVGFVEPLRSQYMALMVTGGEKTGDIGCLVLKWFFGFDPGV